MSSSPESSASPRNRSRSPLPGNNSTAALNAAQALLAPSGQVERRPSIQFAAPRGASRDRPKGDRPKRRISSPPPPPVFQPRVSFDTFGQTVDFIDENSFTLVTKHKDYEYTKRSRTFLCGCDDNDYSEYALQWLIDELVDDGDEIVCLRVVEKDDTIAGERSVEKGRYRNQAEDLMKTIQKKNHENKAINLVLEFAVGKVNKVIDEMINLYEPAILVVGTRGRSLGGFQGLLPGSVSKYCLQHSPVPVIVVRPSSKRDKARNKRALDPNRHTYKDLLEKSGPLLDADGLLFGEDSRQASEDEAAAVAAAIGYKPRRLKGSSPLVKTVSASSEVSSGGGAFLDDMRSPGIVMKSPNLRDLESPDFTSDESSDDDDDDDDYDGNGVMLKDRDDGQEIQGGVATNVMDTALGAILGKSSSKRRTPSKSPARGRGLSKSPARYQVQSPTFKARGTRLAVVDTPAPDVKRAPAGEAKPAVSEEVKTTPAAAEPTEEIAPESMVKQADGEDVSPSSTSNPVPAKAAEPEMAMAEAESEAKAEVKAEGAVDQPSTPKKDEGKTPQGAEAAASS